MARLAMDNKQAFVSGSYPTSGGGGYSPHRTRGEAAVLFGAGMALLGGLLAVAAWGTGLGVATMTGWHLGPVLQGVLGGVSLGSILGALAGLVSAVGDGPSPGYAPLGWAFLCGVLFSVVIALCGATGGALRLGLSSWFAWPIGGLALGGVVGVITGACVGD